MYDDSGDGSAGDFLEEVEVRRFLGAPLVGWVEVCRTAPVHTAQATLHLERKHQRKNTEGSARSRRHRLAVGAGKLASWSPDQATTHSGARAVCAFTRKPWRASREAGVWQLQEDVAHGGGGGERRIAQQAAIRVNSVLLIGL